MELNAEWVTSEPPCKMMTGRTAERSPEKRKWMERVIREFLASPYECWRRDYPGDKRAAVNDAAYLGQVANRNGCMISRRGTSIFLTRRDAG